jgi:hypothetical protein
MSIISPQLETELNGILFVYIPNFELDGGRVVCTEVTDAYWCDMDNEEHEADLKVRSELCLSKEVCDYISCNFYEILSELEEIRIHDRADFRD